MAYDKTTWIDNVTPMDAERFNKMEDALKDAYDNSEEDATVISFFQSIGWTASLTMNKIYSLLNFLGHRDTPIGTVQMFAGATTPVERGWLLCNGQEVSKTTYAKLYAVVGDSYTTGNETEGNFRLPDFRGRVPVGVNSTYTLGRKDGEATHTLTPAETATKNHSHTYAKASSPTGGTAISVAQMPSHNHDSATVSGWVDLRSASAGSMFLARGGGFSIGTDSETANSVSNTGNFAKRSKLTFSHTHSHSNKGGGGTHNHTVSTASETTTGNPSNANGSAHNNMQPYLAINYIIYSGVTE